MRLKNPIPLSTEYYTWQNILENGLFDCFQDKTVCALSTCCTCCLAGSNQDTLGHGCLCSCITFPCLGGCQSSIVYRSLGVKDRGWFYHCLVCCFCSCCVVAQQTRAVNTFIKAHDTETTVPSDVYME